MITFYSVCLCLYSYSKIIMQYEKVKKKHLLLFPHDVVPGIWLVLNIIYVYIIYDYIIYDYFGSAYYVNSS